MSRKRSKHSESESNSAEEKQSIIQSIRELKQGLVIASRTYSDDNKNDRNLVILPVPTKIDKNGKTILIGHSFYHLFNRVYQHRLACSNQAYYLSSGTSNTKEVGNFQGVFFPFLRIQTEAIDPYPKGWIYKYTLGGTKSRTMDEVIESLQKYPEFKGISEQDITLLRNFINKFASWWQIQQSASLIANQASSWLIFPILQKLRIFCLAYDLTYDVMKDNWIIVKNPDIVKIYSILPPDMKTRDPAVINDWLLEHNALCALENQL